MKKTLNYSRTQWMHFLPQISNETCKDLFNNFKSFSTSLRMLNSFHFAASKPVLLKWRTNQNCPIREAAHWFGQAARAKTTKIQIPVPLLIQPELCRSQNCLELQKNHYLVYLFDLEITIATSLFACYTTRDEHLSTVIQMKASPIVNSNCFS